MAVSKRVRYELGVQSGMQYEWRENYDAISHYRDCKKVERK